MGGGVGGHKSTIIWSLTSLCTTILPGTRAMQLREAGHNYWAGTKSASRHNESRGHYGPEQTSMAYL